MELQCPKCRSVLRLEDMPAGTPVQCPACGMLFRHPGKTSNAGSDGVVIDVHAEPVHGDMESPETPLHEIQPDSESELPDSWRGTNPHAGARYVFIEKHFPAGAGSDFGCCGCGCFLLLLFFILFLAGCTAVGIW